MKNKQYEEGQIMLNQKRIADSIAGVNTKLLFELQKDSINDAYTSRLDSLKDIENKLFFLQNQSALIQKIDNYYLDIANNKMNAYDYFSDTVNQFINLFNISPEEINKVFTGELDYTDEHVIFDKNSFIFSSHRADLFYFNYTIQYSCFRKKRNMTQRSDVDIEIGFNDKLQIKSLKELEIRNLIFE